MMATFVQRRQESSLPVKMAAAAALMASAIVMSGCSVGGLSDSGAGSQTASINPEQNSTNLSPNAAILDTRSPVKVALILPLSGNGQTAIVAQAMRRAGEMALFDLDNPAVQLIVKDTKGTPEGAQFAATSALSAGAELIIGPLYAESVRAVKPIARQANVPVIAFSSDPGVAGNGVYLLSFIAGYEINRIVSYAASRGKRHFSALVPESAYGKIVERRIRQAVSRSGAKLAAIETYPLSANGMLAPVKRIKDTMDRVADYGTPVDTLLIAADQTSLPMLGSLMPYARIDTRVVKLIGTTGWNSAAAGREKALLGGWYPSPDPRGWRLFSRRYANNNGGGLPPRIASLTYDAVSLAIDLSSSTKGRRYNAANLTRASGFTGTDGLFRFSANGLPQRKIAILEVQNLGGAVIDPASAGFSQPASSATASGAATISTSTSTRFNLIKAQ